MVLYWMRLVFLLGISLFILYGDFIGEEKAHEKSSTEIQYCQVLN